jgi:hypothetical protein
MLDRFHLLASTDLTSTGLTVAGGAGNAFDTGILTGDFGGGSPDMNKGALELEITPSAAGAAFSFATMTGLQLALQDSADNTTYYDVLLTPNYLGAAPVAPNPAKQSFNKAAAALAVGDRFVIPIPPGVGRYLSYRLVFTGTSMVGGVKVYIRY